MFLSVRSFVHCRPGMRKTTTFTLVLDDQIPPGVDASSSDESDSNEYSYHFIRKPVEDPSNASSSQVAKGVPQTRGHDQLLKLFFTPRAATYTDSDCIVVDDSSSSHETKPSGPASKRRRVTKAAATDATGVTQTYQAAATRAADAAVAGTSAQAGATAGPSADLGDIGSPFSLMWVRGLQDASNTGCLGARLKHLVRGEIQYALVENFMIDFRRVGFR